MRGNRYGTEKAVGDGIKESGIARNQIFVTTKLWNNKHHPDDVPKALDDSLRDLQMDYVDLFLMHYPVAAKRGDDPIPKENGKPVTEDIDRNFSSHIDIQSDGKVVEYWKGESNRSFELQQGSNGSSH